MVDNVAMRASECFTEEDRQRIDRTVAGAESRSAVEILPVVATSSGKYDRAEDAVGLLFGTAAAVVMWTAFAGRVGVGQLLVIGLAGGLIGVIVGVIVAACVPGLRRMFLTRGQMREEVIRRACQVFFDRRVHHTDGHSGMLIYVSLQEGMAAVLADRHVREKVGQPILDQLCNQVEEALKTRGPTAAICETIASAERYLSTSFPAEPRDVDEIQNALVTLDRPE
jgi:putative membrane protein